ncbi:ribonuclease HI [bacterium]|nr:ribonuclease HI [bacterium]
MADSIYIYTDGSSLGNPGPGGYAVVMKYKNLVKELSGGFKKTTNNRMELLAVIEAMKALNAQAEDKEIIIYTDSKYVRDAIEKGWVFKWVKTGFKEKANPDLWRKFLMIYPKYNLKFEWVKGHSGVPENERCDKLAKAAAKGKDLPEDVGFETKSNTLL